MTVPSEMRAWILERPHHLALRRVPTPQPGPGEVLIQIDAGCMCNGSDPEIYHGHEAYPTPMVFGHEASGRIVALGQGVQTFQLGQRVCWWCAMGAFAEYQAVNPDRVAMFPVPENVTLEEAPVLELVIASCRALMKLPAQTGRKKLTILGLGPSGLVLTQYARLLGYERIVGWDLYPPRRALGLELGCDQVIDPSALTPQAAQDLEPSDIGVVMMGHDLLPGEPTADLMMRALRPGATVVSYGHPEGGRRFSPYLFQSRDLTMVGPVNDLAVIREKGRDVMEAVASGGIRIAPLITHVKDFRAFHAAFDHLLVEPSDQIKVILRWEKEEEP